MLTGQRLQGALNSVTSLLGGKTIPVQDHIISRAFHYSSHYKVLNWSVSRQGHRLLHRAGQSKRETGVQLDMTFSSNTADEAEQFTITSETVSYERYMTVYNRRVAFPRLKTGGEVDADGTVERESHDFDVVGHPKANFHFCIAFPYHPPRDKDAHWCEGEVTLIREYAQGPNAMVLGLPAGSFHVESHKTLEGCVRAELSEEAHLCGGSVYKLLDDDCPGIAEVKWCCNRFTPFIAFDPQADNNPGSRDSEEFIEIKRMKISEVKKLLRGGDMLLPSVTTCYWAFEWLEENYKNERSK